jgi:hypothetical protein
MGARINPDIWNNHLEDDYNLSLITNNIYMYLD